MTTRHRALVALVLGAAAGALGLALLTDHLARLQAAGGRDALVQLRATLALAVGIGVAGAFGIGVFCFRLGRQVCREERFPPAGARLVKRTTVHTGAAAVRRGRGAQAFGVVCMVLALALLALLVAVLAHFPVDGAAAVPAPQAMWRDGRIVEVRGCEGRLAPDARLRCAGLYCAQRVTHELPNPQQAKLAVTRTAWVDDARYRVEGTIANDLGSRVQPVAFACDGTRASEPAVELIQPQ